MLEEYIFLNQIIAKKLLTKMGLDVDVANDGQEAIDTFKSQCYDLISMGFRLPVLDGYKATQAIRKIEKERNKTAITISALTVNYSSDDRILCEKSGMNDVVTKPFRPADLSECLKQWLP